MGQVSAKLRRVDGGYAHWCPGCEETHVIPDSWSFNGDVDAPTFNPSVRITGKKAIVKDGRWTGEWVRDANGNTVDDCCHYFLHAGVLRFQGDSKHALAGKNVPLPDLPAHLRDHSAGRGKPSYEPPAEFAQMHAELCAKVGVSEARRLIEDHAAVMARRANR